MFDIVQRGFAEAAVQPGVLMPFGGGGRFGRSSTGLESVPCISNDWWDERFLGIANDAELLNSDLTPAHFHVWLITISDVLLCLSCVSGGPDSPRVSHAPLSHTDPVPLFEGLAHHMTV